MANYTFNNIVKDSDTFFVKDYAYHKIFTCDTAAATAAKTVTAANVSVVAGISLKIKFTYANTAANPTLSVNSSTPANIYAYGTTVPTQWWRANEIVVLTYDGTAWYLSERGNDSGGSSGGIEVIRL